MEFHSDLSLPRKNKKMICIIYNSSISTPLLSLFSSPIAALTVSVSSLSTRVIKFFYTKPSENIIYIIPRQIKSFHLIHQLQTSGKVNKVQEPNFPVPVDVNNFKGLRRITNTRQTLCTSINCHSISRPVIYNILPVSSPYATRSSYPIIDDPDLQHFIEKVTGVKPTESSNELVQRQRNTHRSKSENRSRSASSSV